MRGMQSGWVMVYTTKSGKTLVQQHGSEELAEAASQHVVKVGDAVTSWYGNVNDIPQAKRYS